MSLPSRLFSLRKQPETGALAPAPIAGWAELEASGGGDIRQSERGQLITAIEQFQPVESLLEVGCGIGINLPLLRLFYPDLAYVGLDRNEAALAKCEGDGRARFLKGDLVEGIPLADGEVDLVVSIATLLYLRGEHIRGALSEMLRVSKRGVILVEQNDPEESIEGSFVTDDQTRSGYWVRNYGAIFAEMRRAFNLHRIAAPRFETEQWGRYGSVLICRKEECS